MDNKISDEILEAAQLVYLDKDNCNFYENGDFLGLELKNGTKYDRVDLRRLFPFKEKSHYISVTTTDLEEIGIIKDINDFPESTRNYIKRDLARRYYVCHLSKVVDIKDRYGFSYWDCVDRDGSGVSFSLTSSHANVITSPSGQILLTDIDGNRYDLPPFEQLDRVTKRKIESYR